MQFESNNGNISGSGNNKKVQQKTHVNGVSKSVVVSATSTPLGRRNSSPFYSLPRKKQDMNDWEIPFSDLKFGILKNYSEFCEIWSGYWHGDVSIKLWKVENPSEEFLDDFRNEIRTLRKLRHHNIQLFMGASIALPNLAIVTRLCKGASLFDCLHVQEIKFSLSDCFDIIIQAGHGKFLSLALTNLYIDCIYMYTHLLQLIKN